LFLNAVFWSLRTGAAWQDLHPDLGDSKNTHRRSCRWRDKLLWEPILERLIDEPDKEWLIIDPRYVKVYPQAAWVVEAMRPWCAQNRAQHQNPSGRG
jgi:transposase